MELVSEIKKIYHVRFKRKDFRENKRDDKITLLKRAISMDTEKITRKEERVLDLTVRGLQYLPDDRLIMDFNHFEIPKVTVPLSPDQVTDVQRLAEDPNSDVLWIYEDFVPNIELKEVELLGSQFIPLAPIDDAKTREIITGNIKAVKADKAWVHKKGAGVKVAVMDTGVDKNHPDMRDNYAGGYVAGSGDGSDPGAAPGNSHGTACASIIGAVMGNGQGIAGCAPECEIYSVRVFKISGAFVTEGEFQAAITWCGTNKMDVLSMSLGSADPASMPKYNEQDTWPQYLKDEQAAIKSTYDAGCLICAAVGNENDGGKPSNKYADRTYPAGFDWLAAVSALHPGNQFVKKPPHWWGSNSGNHVHLCGPGESDDPGQNQDQKKSDFGVVARSDPSMRNGYQWFRGTSMATPNVAGVAVLGFSAWKHNACVGGVYDGYPNERPKQNVIARCMAATADGLGSSDWPDNQQVQTGWGLPNAERVVRALLNINGEGSSLIVAPLSIAPTATDPKPIPIGLFI
jgi:subtilisin